MFKDKSCAAFFVRRCEKFCPEAFENRGHASHFYRAAKGVSANLRTVSVRVVSVPEGPGEPHLNRRGASALRVTGRAGSGIARSGACAATIETEVPLAQ
jgi:hypothetical protein